MAKVTINLQPTAGRQVRKEDGSLLPIDGCDVPNNSYYRRRLADGDVELTTKTKPAKVAKGDS